MFKTSANDYIYPFESITEPTGSNLYLPLAVDTEYTHVKFDLNHPFVDRISDNITVQCKAVAHKKGLIYTHPDSEKIARHPLFKSNFIAIDYLNSYNYKTELTRLPNWDTKVDLPWIQIDLYAYFAVAEIMRIFQGFCLDDITFLIVNPGKAGIEQSRRLRTYTQVGQHYSNYVELPWVLKINNIDYRVRLAIYDACAIHGHTSYAGFSKNAGIELEYKDNFTSEEKAIMDKMYVDRPDEFDDYALGDLFTHEGLIANSANFERIHETLGLKKYFSPPRLTIGSTVARMFEASIKNLFNSDSSNRDIINAFCKFASTDWLKRKSTSTACLNAKVDGGRCRNNRPIETSFSGALCDIDISGCYGEGLRVQTYPLGIPMLISYPLNSDKNVYESLRKFLDKYGKELVPGLWQARVILKDGYKLKNDQDYLVSWFPPKDISKMPTDTNFADTDEFWTVDNVGEIKILNNDVHHAIITHDFIQWLFNVASEKQRTELLENLIIETALIYPQSERVDNIDALMNSHKNHKGKNTSTLKIARGKSKSISVNQECHTWYGVDLGKLIVDKLLLERKKHPKKTSFNDLYKLCTNTLYGDMVSPFFEISNVVVGNNITARARALAWCMEKGLHGWQTITDGCTFDLNRVLVPRDKYRVTGAMATNLYANDRQDNYCFKSLYSVNELCVTLNSVKIELFDFEGLKGLKFNLPDKSYILTPEESMTWVNSAAMKHLQQLFPNLDVLHQMTKDVYGNERKGQFQFEAKGFFESGTFHGGANYSLSVNGVNKIAMRSYSKEKVKYVLGVDDLQVYLAENKPSDTFLLALNTPDCVGRANVYFKERILKIGDYRRNYRKWQNTKVYPGVTVISPSILREFSLSQFTFKTYEQYKSWCKEHNRLIQEFGQSYEMFFLNEDATLDFTRMVETVDTAIRLGKNSFFDGLPRHIVRDKYVKSYHASNDTLQKVAKQLGILYNCNLLADLSDNEIVEEFAFSDLT